MAVKQKIKGKQEFSLEQKINAKTAKIGIIGLGYVGLPVAVAFSRAGFSVTGTDLDPERVYKINEGTSYISDVSNDELETVIKKKRLKATTDFEVIEELNVVIICVPTPITSSKTPDLSYVIDASNEVSKYLQQDQLVILESTTYPGTTEEAVLPILESTGFKAGKDFSLVFSPERVDPGNKEYRVQNTPKIVGGLTDRCSKIANKLYSAITSEVIVVSSPKVAETTKLFENVFRNVNIALVNELSILCQKMGISVWEVIDAASTKPFGFTRFDPGPGVGGHCIPLDPYYLAAKAKEFDFHCRFIELSGEINENMPYYVAEKIGEALNKHGKAIRESKILVLGVAYKKDIDDTRESPALKIISTLERREAIIFYNDPYVYSLNLNGKKLTSSEVSNDLLKSMDCVVIVSDHSVYNFKEIVAQSKLVIDTRNATRNLSENRQKIVRF